MASTTPTSSGSDPAPRPKRRTFTAEYKLRMVAEYDAAPAGEKGAVLRRERLYHSHIIEWRQAREAGTRDGWARRTVPLERESSSSWIETRDTVAPKGGHRSLELMTRPLVETEDRPRKVRVLHQTELLSERGHDAVAAVL